MADQDLALMAHLMRRAGFGAPRAELEARLAKGYEATVEELLHPEDQEPVDFYRFLRYHPNQWKPGTLAGIGHSGWVYRMLNTRAPLQEKIALFWHQVFATGVSKVDHWHEVTNMVDAFRERGLGRFGEILSEVSKSPAMIFWLDNQENHSYAVNENWGRELLELFSLGVGSYTERDVFEASRAFTGWTMPPTLPRFTMGRFDWEFEFRSEDHDGGPKEFLGHAAGLNGDDVLDIVLKQPACARFVARHMYNFFVADEPPVPTWPVEAPRDSNAVDTLVHALLESDYDIRHTLRVLFNSEFFKAARSQRVKSPAEVVVGTLRLAGDSDFPGPDIMDHAERLTNMGQELLNPPTVEGWHTGREWINTGSFVKRTNYFAEVLGDTERAGVQDIHRRLRALGAMSAEEFVEACLDLLGPIQVEDETMRDLVEHASRGGPVSWSGNGSDSARVTEMVQLIVATRDYQFA